MSVNHRPKPTTDGPQHNHSADGRDTHVDVHQIVSDEITLSLALGSPTMFVVVVVTAAGIEIEGRHRTT